jgi:hypothetical protein
MPEGAPRIRLGGSVVIASDLNTNGTCPRSTALGSGVNSSASLVRMLFCSIFFEACASDTG